MTENSSSINYHEAMGYSLEPLIIHSNHKILYINHAAEEFFRATKEEVIGASPLDIFQETSKAAIKERIESAYEQPAEVIEETVYRMDGTTVDVELYCHPLLVGETKAIQSSVKDISRRRESEEKQKEMVRAINELSATIVPLLSGIAVLPLVGSIDKVRANHLLEDVPSKAKNQGVNCLIIDFSGTYKLDSIVTEHLFKISSVLSMLGIQSVITGLRPELALSATQLGVTLDSIPKMSTVKDALYSLGMESNKRPLI